MCGRFALTASAPQIKQHFALVQAAAMLTPRYNIAPSQTVVVVKDSKLDFATWGFKVLSYTNYIINIKIETILEKKWFGSLFKQQRCLIVASGFFEWKTIDNKKIPFYVQIKQENIIGFAGIFINDSCVILTTANGLARVPVIIAKNNYNLWLAKKTPVDLLQDPKLQVLKEDFVIYPVTPQVNNPKFDNVMCIKSLD